MFHPATSAAGALRLRGPPHPSPGAAGFSSSGSFAQPSGTLRQTVEGRREGEHTPRSVLPTQPGPLSSCEEPAARQVEPTEL